MHRYLAVRPPVAPAGLRLFCFHHAGAGAMTYAGWKQRTGPAVSVLPVRLPGRESRLREPRITDGDQLLGELTADLAPLLEEDVPFAFYGHSLGALVAYRFAEHLQSRGRRSPAVLLVGAAPAPQLASAVLDGHRALRPELPDGQLLAALGDEEAMPAALRDRPDRLALVLATLRDDLRLARSLRTGPVVPLSCPVEAFAGTADRLVRAEEVRAWAQCTSAAFRFWSVPGTHQFVRGTDLPHLLTRSLARACAAQPADTANGVRPTGPAGPAR
ncbi:thioesterase II family protein [Streptomyces sp. NPDC006879]|uniref:thioesterase II family protein n=1 Tax=Streptomyces sp. NPDC006879 TaxID=3364767 RepID=UPI0036ADB716